MVAMQVQTYRGPERRVHRMYVTRNTEYHLRGEICVAVRDRRTGRWLPSHLAIHRRLAGGVRIHPNGAAVPSCVDPCVGDALYFDGAEREPVTSLLSCLDRPGRALVRSYPSA